MKFAEFKKEIEALYHGKFNKSFVECSIFKCLGISITIDMLLAENSSECQHNITDNDIMRIGFMIYLPDDWKETDDLPENLTMKALNNAIRVKPDNDYLYCSTKKVAYRKATGTAENLIKAYGKYVDKLYQLVSEEYNANNLLDFDAALFKTKYAE